MMETSYGGFIGFLTQSPEDWDHVVKEEPTSPNVYDSPNSDSSPYSSRQSIESLHAEIPYHLRSQSFVAKEEKFPNQDKSLDLLMSLDPSSFLPVPDEEVYQILAIEGDPFVKNVDCFRLNESSYRRTIVKTSNPHFDPKCEAKISPFVPYVTPTIGYCDSSPQPVQNAHWNSPRSSTDLHLPDLLRTVHRLSPLTCDKVSTPPQKTKGRRIKHTKKYGHILWKFILELLMKVEYQHVICWTGNKLAFKIVDKDLVSQLWSKAKVRQPNVKISYESITRALRSYKPKNRAGVEKPAIISHSPESNFTYYFNEFYHQQISEEANLSFPELLKFVKAKCISS